ncbi:MULTISPECIES: DNA repair protein RecO [Oceanimonas]|uniref:DNA repair protein RecO n=1 Tax=Oceanimonas doudoroffii TaxID=84158 RepID=A0A233RCI4_9GAMM|nr:MULTISPECIES: DNA repair protein RecO [Oceanimonas]NHI00928.1 DNA repair protein RecO [Oceanimonas sp. MB9]OXY81107.1 DNA repair protein RecO [Oceanimonas doudoroffii]
MAHAAFVIHSRPYRETSQLVEVFTREQGRQSLVARGSRQPRSPLKGLLQPFVPLRLTFGGKGELKTLYGAEATAPALTLTGTALYSGLYLNELIYYLLEAQTPFDEVFDVYFDTLRQLGSGSGIEPVLRRFEFYMLNVLGYGVDFTQDADTGAAVVLQGWYAYLPEAGFMALDGPEPGAFRGDWLHALAELELSSPEVLAAAKRFSRLALAPYLEGRVLKSRALFIKGKRGSPSE